MASYVHPHRMASRFAQDRDTPPMVDARSGAAKERSIRGANLDISGNVVSGKDKLTGETVQWPARPSALNGPKHMAPIMTPNLKPKVTPYRGGMAAAQQKAQPVATVPPNGARPVGVDAVNPYAMDGKPPIAPSYWPQQPGTAAQDAPAVQRDFRDTNAEPMPDPPAPVTSAPATPTPPASRLNSAPVAPVAPVVTDFRPADQNPHGQAYLSRLSDTFLQQHADMAAAKAAGTMPDMSKQGDEAAKKMADVAPQPNLAPAVQAGASRIALTDPKYGGPGYAMARPSSPEQAMADSSRMAAQPKGAFEPNGKRFMGTDARQEQAVSTGRQVTGPDSPESVPSESRFSNSTPTADADEEEKRRQSRLVA